MVVLGEEIYAGAGDAEHGCDGGRDDRAASSYARAAERVIEFLNVQLSPAEVIGIEVRQYVGRA
jgi:hypothetical protein